MKRYARSTTSGSTMPRWFRAVLFVGFALLFLGYALVRGERTSSASATNLDALAYDAERSLAFEAHPTRRTQLSGRGQFRLNGMLVRFNAYPVRDATAKLREMESALKKVGYRTRRKTINGEDTVIGIHPRTKVMLTVAATTLGNGLPAVRLTQRNLGELKGGFRPALAGIPELPGAQTSLLISSVEGPRTETLSYRTNDPRDWVSDFYLRELPDRGWQRLIPPIDLTSAFSTLFFARDGEECSIMIVPAEDRGSVVMVTRAPGVGGS